MVREFRIDMYTLLYLDYTGDFPGGPVAGTP